MPNRCPLRNLRRAWRIRAEGLRRSLAGQTKAEAAAGSFRARYCLSLEGGPIRPASFANHAYFATAHTVRCRVPLSISIHDRHLSILWRPASRHHDGQVSVPTGLPIAMAAIGQQISSRTRRRSLVTPPRSRCNSPGIQGCVGTDGANEMFRPLMPRSGAQTALLRRRVWGLVPYVRPRDPLPDVFGMARKPREDVRRTPGR